MPAFLKHRLINPLRTLGALLVLPFFLAFASASTLDLHPEQPAPKPEESPKKPIPPPSTPLGIYKKTVADEIGKSWYSRVQRRMDYFGIGDARVSFLIDKKGQIEKLRLCSNTSNSIFASLCMTCVSETKLSPPPSGLFQTLKDEKLEITFNFQLRP